MKKKKSGELRLGERSKGAEERKTVRKRDRQKKKNVHGVDFLRQGKYLVRPILSICKMFNAFLSKNVAIPLYLNFQVYFPAFHCLSNIGCTTG